MYQENIMFCFFFLDELSHEKEKSKSLTDEMDQTFSELTGY